MGRSQKERGATLVEASLMLPVIILLTVSLLELGLAFRDILTVSFTARDAARVGALAGNDIDADCHVIQTVVEGFGSAGVDGVTVDIFKAHPSDGSPSAFGYTWTPSGGDPTDCATWVVAPNAVEWPSADRQVLAGSTPLDILGVTIHTQHEWVTGLPPWRGTMNLDRTALQRLEPEACE